MAVLPILISGDPVLHSPARTVSTFDDQLRALVEDMVETMRAAPGVGLAAPQVGVDLRVFVFEWTDDEGVHSSGTAINPKLWITPVVTGDPHEEDDSEGCLSVPGERFPLARADEAILQAVDLGGTPFELRASGWLARILQHEFDHLDGVLYTDRLDNEHGKLARRAIKKNGWGHAGVSWMPGQDQLEG